MENPSPSPVTREENPIPGLESTAEQQIFAANENEILSLGIYDDVIEPFNSIEEEIPVSEPTGNNTPPTAAPTRDAIPPVSTVEILPNSVGEDFTVTWWGLDNDGGSSVATYDVFVSTDGGEFELWQDNTTDISAVYDGESDRQYAFYSVATDGEGNTEQSDTTAQSNTSTNGNEQRPTIFRFFNPAAGVHFYTSTVNERDFVFTNLDNYTYEGASYFGGSLEGSVPVYRFFNTATGVHLYTIDEKEKNALLENSAFEFNGEVFNAYSEQVEGTIPVYRFFNTRTGAHFYTPNVNERENVEANLPDFQPEGIAYYSFPLDTDFTALRPPSNTISPVESSSITNFEGSTVGLQLYGPNLDTPITDILTAPVGGGVEFVDLPASDLEGGLTPIDVNVDISADSVLFEVEQAGSGTFDGGEFNGYILVRDPNTSISIENVTIDQSATTLEIDSSNIISTEEGIAVNVAGVNYQQGDTLKLDVSFGDGTTTEPNNDQEGPGFFGSQIQHQSFNPNLETPVGDPTDLNPGEGSELTIPFIETGNIIIDIENSSIIFEIDATANGTFTNNDEDATFNGEGFFDLTDSLPPIQNVTIDQSVTTLGVDAADVVFIEDAVALNLADLPYQDGDIVKLDVEFGESGSGGSSPENSPENAPPQGPPESGSNYDGSTVGLQLYGPNLDTPVTDVIPAQVGDGVEFGDIPASDLEGGLTPIDVNIDVSTNSIFLEVEESGSGTFDGGEFNGYVLVNDPNANLSISNVIIDQSATTLGIDSSNIVFLAEGLAINVAGVDYQQGDTLKLDVDFGESSTSTSESVSQDSQPGGTPAANNLNFEGAELQSQFFAPDLNSPISELFVETVGEGEEFFYDDGPGSLRNFVDISGNTINYRGEFAGNFTYADVEFVGFVVEDVSDNLPPIENVSINSGSSIPIESSAIVFNENRIEVNLDGLSFTDVGTISVDVDFAEI